MRIIKQLKSSINFKRIVEIVVLLVCTYPFVTVNFQSPLRYKFRTYNVCYSLNDFLYYFMFLRFILLYKAVMSFTPYQNHLARSSCLNNNVKANARFAFRCMIFQHPTKVILLLLVIPSVIVLGIMVRIFERPLNDITDIDFGDPLNAI